MLNERLGKVLAETRLTQEQFAVATGVGLERIKNMVQAKAKTMRDAEAEAIQRRFGWRASWVKDGKGAQRLTKEEQQLLCGDGAPLPALKQAQRLVSTHDINDPHLAEFAKRAFVATALGKLDELERAFEDWLRLPKGIDLVPSGEFVYVPKYDLAASAGAGTSISDESIVDHLAFKREWVKRSLGLDAAHLALIDARGDSMNPTIESGDLLLLDTRPGHVKAEGVYVINLRGALLVKRIRIKLNGVVEVTSDNPQYGSETISGDELDRLALVGRVVWHGRKF